MKKKIKSKMFLVDWTVYPFQVLVCLGSERQDILKKIKQLGYKLSSEETDKIQMYGQGRAVMLKGGQTIIWTEFFPCKMSGLLAHEILHAVQFLMDKVGIKLTSDSDEAFCYATEYLTNQINKQIS